MRFGDRQRSLYHYNSPRSTVEQGGVPRSSLILACLGKRQAVKGNGG